MWKSGGRPQTEKNRRGGGGLAPPNPAGANAVLSQGLFQETQTHTTEFHASRSLASSSVLSHRQNDYTSGWLAQRSAEEGASSC